MPSAWKETIARAKRMGCIAPFVLLLALPSVAFGLPESSSPVQPFAYVEEVTDTYKSFYPRSGAANQIVDRYGETYKRLEFKNSYAFTGANRYYSEMGNGPRGGYGTISWWRCSYRIW